MKFHESSENRGVKCHPICIKYPPSLWTLILWRRSIWMSKVSHIILEFWEPATLLKKNPTQILSSEICKLFKNNYLEEHQLTSASKHYLKRDSNTVVFLWILCIIQEHLFCRGSMNGWFWIPVRGSLFNKAASLTGWRHLAVLERDSRAGISMWILRNF